MQNVLNPILYQTLKDRFKKVKISNPGIHGKIYYKSYEGKIRPKAKGGEYYRVNCPVCKDTRGRLWVHHLFGKLDPRTNIRILDAAYCFNCSATPGKANLGDLLRPSFAKIGCAPIGDVSEQDINLTKVDTPAGQYSRLVELDADHPARVYLESRNFDLSELDKSYWMFCRCSDHKFIDRRIYIRVLHNVDGSLVQVGWQTRAVPNYSTRLLPKYYTMPSFPKSHVLYNLYQAQHCDTVVLTEGVTDSERVGKEGVALLGKTISSAQIKLLHQYCKDAQIVVLLDEDARSNAWSICQALNAGAFSAHAFKKEVFMVSLSRGGDPSEYSRDEVWGEIRSKKH